MKNPKIITLTLTALTVFALICIPAGQVQVAVGKESYQLTLIVKYDLTFIQATQTQAMANTLIITAKDANNNTVPYTGSVILSSSDTKAIFSTGNIAISNGIGSSTFYFGTSGPQTVTAIDTSNSQIVGTTMTNVAPIHLNLTTSATSVTQGQTVNITVTALDTQNHILTELGNQGYGATIIFASTDTTAILPDEDINNKLVSGTGTFNVTLNTLGPQTITVINKNFDPITATTTAITVNPPTTPTENPSPTATMPPAETTTATPTAQPQADSQPTKPPTSNTQLDTLTIAAVVATIITVAVLALLILMKTGKLARKQTLPPPSSPTDSQNQH